VSTELTRRREDKNNSVPKDSCPYNEAPDDSVALAKSHEKQLTLAKEARSELDSTQRELDSTQQQLQRGTLREIKKGNEENKRPGSSFEELRNTSTVHKVARFSRDVVVHFMMPSQAKAKCR
jgi:hypothetical protein